MALELSFKDMCSQGHAPIAYSSEDCPLCESLGRERRLHELNARLLELHKQKDVVIAEAISRLNRLGGELARN